MASALFIGVDLQRDLTETEGGLPIEGGDRIVSVARRLIEHAQGRKIPVVLSADTHADDDPVFEAFPTHCVEGTPGHDLAPALGLDEDAVLMVPDDDVGPVEVQEGQPVVLQSSHHRRGLFANLNTDRVLNALGDAPCVVFGSILEVGVKATVNGLLQRGREVVLVSDGVGRLDGDRASHQLASMAALGCQFMTADGVTQRFG